MGKVKYIRLKAATLIETIVALVIILVIFGIVTTFLVQISVNSFSLQHIKASQLVNIYANKTAEEKSFFDEQIEQDNLIIKRQIITDYSNPNLVHLKFMVYERGGKLVLLKQKLISSK